MLAVRTDWIAVRFIPHKYDDGSGWLGIEATDGKVLPLASDSFFRLDLKAGMSFDDARELAASLNQCIEAFGQSQLLPPASLKPF
jgi:hypothetical protein